MGHRVTLWQRIKSAVSNIDTLIKVWKWIRLLFIPVIAVAGMHQYETNQRLDQAVAEVKAKIVEPVKEVTNTIVKPQKTIERVIVEKQIDNKALLEHIEQGH